MELQDMFETELLLHTLSFVFCIHLGDIGCFDGPVCDMVTQMLAMSQVIQWSLSQYFLL